MIVWRVPATTTSWLKLRQRWFPRRLGRDASVCVPWTENRLLSRLQTASCHHYVTNRFMGDNLMYGAKVKTMENIRSSLGKNKALWPGVPETLD